MKSIKHGGDLSRIQALYPNAPRPWLDLSTGLNPVPWAWPDHISQAEILAASTALPDHDLEAACKTAWTGYLAVQTPGDWSLSAGTQSIINLLPQLFPDHGVCLPEPTYGEHVRVWQNAERPVQRLAPDGLLQQSFGDHQVVVITNPNNPDGRTYEPAELLELARHLQAQDSFLIVDEAFCDVLPAHSLTTYDLPPNVIILRSFGKFFGLAGLRIGMYRAANSLRDTLQTLQGPWPVNAPALLIAVCATADAAWISDTRQRLKRDGNRLNDILSDGGLAIVGGTDLFCLVRNDKASDIVQNLARQGIHIRSFIEHDQHLRFGLPATDEGFDRLKSALAT